MTITEREGELFAQWQVNRSGFVADGVVDEEAYMASYPKILLVLKEVNDAGAGGWDLREYLRDGGRERTWNNVTRCVNGIRNLNTNFDWESIKKVDPENRHSALRSICVMNLKNSPGSHTCDPDALTSIATEDRTLIGNMFPVR